MSDNDGLGLPGSGGAGTPTPRDHVDIDFYIPNTARNGSSLNDTLQDMARTGFLNLIVMYLDLKMCPLIAQDTS